jgi:hypothetical protein
VTSPERWIGAGLVVGIAMVETAAPLLAPHSPFASGIDMLALPSAAHWLGTDDLGRDVLSRVIYGARASLAIGFGAALLATFVGVPVGLLAGTLRGTVDVALAALIDLFIALPGLVLALIITVMVGPSLRNLILVLGFVMWPPIARLVRGQALAIREMLFVEAARATGGRSLQQRGPAFGTQPVGTGAFVLKEWTRGSRVVLKRNPNYWQKGLPYLDRIVVQDLAGSVIGVQRLLTGEIDYVDQLTPAPVVPIGKRAGIVLKPITVGRWYFLQWHVNEPPFDNPKLRQAFAHAIDRNRLNDITMRGQGTISDGLTPPGLWWYDPSLKSYPHDPARAKALLTEAGHPNGFEYVLSTPLVTVFQQINQLLQEQLGVVGIKVTLQPVAASEWYARVVSGATNLTPTRWTQRADSDGLLYILFHSKGFALLDQARTVYDMAKRKQIYAEAQRQIVADLPMLPLLFGAEYAALRSPVNGFEWIPDQIPRFRDLWKSA